MYGNDSTESKANFNALLPTAKRSIAKIMGENLTATYSDLNIMLYGQRLSSIISNVNIAMPLGSEVQFSEYVKDKYEYWECSEANNMCNGFFMVTSEVCIDNILLRSLKDFFGIRTLF